MPELFNIDIATHDTYARAQEEVRAFKEQYHLPASGTRYIAIQSKVLDFIPKYPAATLLLQTFIKKSWARFAIPKNYHNQRFLSSYIAPSLGPREKQDADIAKIENVLKRKKRERDGQQNQEEEDRHFEEEAEALIRLLEEGVKETNLMVDFVISRMYQFVQA